VATAFHDDPQIVLASEIDGGDDIIHVRAATAYMLGLKVQASTQPRACVSPTSSPR
jgi:hypothetical protein